MLIRCWGSRGSLPVSGKQFTRYGGDTTCIEIRTESGHTIIIDAGSGIRALGNRLDEENVTSVTMLFTHAHWDHIIGFPFFSPLYRRGFKASLFGCPYTFESYEHILDGLMSPPYCPVRIEALRARLSFRSVETRPFSLGSVLIHPLHLNHPNGGLGYRIEENSRALVFLTDNNLGFHHDGGLLFREYAQFCEGAALLMHDAEFTEEEYVHFKHYGHSSVSDVLRLATEAQVEELGLFHHNKDRTDAQLDRMVKQARSGGDGLPLFAVATGDERNI